jgi:hypothetical protein
MAVAADDFSHERPVAKPITNMAIPTTPAAKIVSPAARLQTRFCSSGWYKNSAERAYYFAVPQIFTGLKSNQDERHHLDRAECASAYEKATLLFMCFFTL